MDKNLRPMKQIKSIYLYPWQSYMQSMIRLVKLNSAGTPTRQESTQKHKNSLRVGLGRPREE